MCAHVCLAPQAIRMGAPEPSSTCAEVSEAGDQDGELQLPYAEVPFRGIYTPWPSAVCE